jgi:hypothetical protein
MRRLILIAVLICGLITPERPAGARATPTQGRLAASDIVLPRRSDSVRFAVIGDGGTGQRAQYETAATMADAHALFPFEFVLMAGDNIYGAQGPADFVLKFERPYAKLLERGVKFYASLGNHDNPNQRFYKLFNMGGERYYSFKHRNTRFFALDSNYVDRRQLDWIERELRNSNDDWKICFFHHPIYSSGGRHGSDLELRVVLEPLFVRHGVRVVFAGHDHFYERIKPQQGIHYFVSGAAGQLRPGDIRAGGFTAKGFARDRHFVLVEIHGDNLHFQAISRDGQTVDSGVLTRNGE